MKALGGDTNTYHAQFYTSYARLRRIHEFQQDNVSFTIIIISFHCLSPTVHKNNLSKVLHLQYISSLPKIISAIMLITLHPINTSRGGRKLTYKKNRGDHRTFQGFKTCFRYYLGFLILKRSKVGAFAIPFRILSPSNITEDNLLCNSMYCFVEKKFQATPSTQDLGTSYGFFSKFPTSS